MIIRHDFFIDDLHYVLVFQHFSFQFYLKSFPNKYRAQLTSVQRQTFSSWGDDPVYEDLNIRIPALAVMRKVMALISHMVDRYRIKYWEFCASSFKKAQIYQKLLERYILDKPHYSYIRDGLNFYVYVQQD